MRGVVNIQCTFEELKDDLKWVAIEFDKNGFRCRAYNKGVQFNVPDRSGIIHEFYPTTGTVIFHFSSLKEDRGKIKTFRNKDIHWFMEYLNAPEKIKGMF